MESQLERMQSRNDEMQSQVEISLSQSHEHMGLILKENKKLEHQTTLLNERTERLRAMQAKLQEVEADLARQKELTAAAEKKKTQLLVELTQHEDSKIQLEAKVRNLNTRFKATEQQLQETTAENASLQAKLNDHNSSFVSAGTTQSVELLKANYERDEHKWNAEKLALNSKITELEQTIANKDNDAQLLQQRLHKKHQQDMQMTTDAYEERLEEV